MRYAVEAHTTEDGSFELVEAIDYHDAFVEARMMARDGYNCLILQSDYHGYWSPVEPTSS
jgi:hypothetical protein